MASRRTGAIVRAFGWPGIPVNLLRTRYGHVLRFRSISQEDRALSFEDSTSFSAPSAFGPFRVLHQIGTGALGPVFRTYDPQRDRLIAVKAFKLDLVPEDVARLAESLRRLASLSRPIRRSSPSSTRASRARRRMRRGSITAETLDVALRIWPRRRSRWRCTSSSNWRTRLIRRGPAGWDTARCIRAMCSFAWDERRASHWIWHRSRARARQRAAAGATALRSARARRACRCGARTIGRRVVRARGCVLARRDCARAAHASPARWRRRAGWRARVGHDAGAGRARASRARRRAGGSA